MRKNRQRLIALIIILVLITGFILAKDKFMQVSTKKPQQVFSSVKPEQIQKILISKDNKTTTIYKKQNKWLVTKDKIEYSADPERIQKIIDNFLSLKKEEIFSTNKNKHKDFGINNQKIELQTNNNSYVLYIGNTSGLSKNYVRLDNQNDIFDAESFDNAFYPDDYRDLAVRLISDENKVSSIEINFENKILKLEKKGNDWFIQADKVKKDRVDFFLNDLKTLKASDILPKDTLIAQVISGFISVKENSLEKKIIFYSSDKDNYLAKSSISNSVFQIPTAYVSSLNKVEKDFTE